MTKVLNVHLLPELANPHELAGHTSVVIDVLRASTTITTALENGASNIVPCLAVEEARQLGADREGALLGGERGGKPLPGFDFGNSPAEYTADRVAGRTIVFTTTNGTKAMMRCMGSARILIASLVNRAAVCEELAADDDSQQIDILCAGTNGEFSMEDALAAGAIVDGLLQRASDGWEFNDGAQISRTLWQADRDDIESSLARSRGGRNLIEIGMRDDLKLAAAVDQFARVPAIDKAVWEIR